VGLGVSACEPTASGSEQPVGLMNIQHLGPRGWPLMHSPLVRQADTLSSIASAIQRPQGRDRAGVQAQVLRLPAAGPLAQSPHAGLDAQHGERAGHVDHARLLGLPRRPIEVGFTDSSELLVGRVGDPL
jgi:hypothetical protein